MGAGDFLAWEMSGGGVARVRGVKPLDLGYLRPLEETLAEWGGAQDEEAYRIVIFEPAGSDAGAAGRG